MESYKELPVVAEKPRFHEAIMSYTEYAAFRHERPYEYHLAAGDEKVLFFGPGHTNDPTNPAFQTIRERIETFQPDIVMVEGIEGVNALSKADVKERVGVYTEQEMIMRYGEPYFTAKLAAERDIKVISPEPSDAAALKYLEAHGHTREVIFCQQMAALNLQYQRTQTKPPLEEYLVPYFASMRRDFPWPDFDFSLAQFERLHEQVFGIPRAAATGDFYKKAADPVPWEGQPYGPTNRVAAAWGVFRDEFILDTIQDVLGEYKKVFIVYGASHAVILEPALRKLMAARTTERGPDRE